MVLHDCEIKRLFQIVPMEFNLLKQSKENENEKRVPF